MTDRAHLHRFEVEVNNLIAARQRNLKFMRCYFWGTNNRKDRDERGRGVISFAIPDWGVQFRAAQPGNATECEYAALLALLRFIESNNTPFEGVGLQIYSDAAAVVYQVNRNSEVPPEQVRQWALARRVRSHRPFDLGWVPRDQNRAFDNLLNLAPITLKTSLHFPVMEAQSLSDERLRNDSSSQS